VATLRDASEGANDDAMLLAITKLSHLHFATNPAAASRIRQMGEDHARICTSGSPGIDNLTSKRPADGISPLHFWSLLGRPANRDYAADEAIDAIYDLS